MLTILALMFSITFWFFFYGGECALNGAMMNSPMHIRYVLDELSWILPPGAAERRLEYCDGDKELADSLPGPFHFIFMHIIIPFWPLILKAIL